MKLYSSIVVAGMMLGWAAAQQAGTSSPEVHPELPMETCTASGCTAEATKIVVDANWRWTYKVGTSTNCYTGNKWDTSICATNKECAAACALDGAKYKETYGISTASKEVTLGFVTKHQYGTNIGSRIYLMEDDTNYKHFKLLNQEFTFDVDASQLECGLNGALYFVQMDKDGGMAKYPTNKAGAKYGTGYCDAQCPHDIKFINGEANAEGWTASNGDPNSGNGKYGSCCMEMDIWEANKMSNAYTSHPCSVDGQYRCSSDTECGFGKGMRYRGVCDKDGCDYNPFRLGNKNFYGPGSNFTIDSTKPVTVVTQFITDDKTASGNLVEIKRFYKQGDKVIKNSPIAVSGVDATNSITDKVCGQMKTTFGDTDDHAAKGSLKTMGKALQSGVVLVMSLWDDHEANCLWLDSSYPLDKDASLPGVARGTCPTTSGKPADVEAKYPTASVKFSNIRVGAIGSTVSGLSGASSSAGSSNGAAEATTSTTTTATPSGTASTTTATPSSTGSSTATTATPSSTTTAPGSTSSPSNSATTATTSTTTSPTASDATTTPAATTTAPKKNCRRRRY